MEGFENNLTKCLPDVCPKFLERFTFGCPLFCFRKHSTLISQHNMNKKILALGVSIALFAMLAVPSGCYYDNEVTQYGITPCDTTAISYSQDIQPIIQDNCIRCHAPGGQQESNPFTSYAEVKLYTADRKIVERVNGIGGIMPPSGAISACSQLKIEAWVNAGAPDN